VDKILGRAQKLEKSKKVEIDYPVTVDAVRAVVETYMSDAEKNVLITELGGYVDLGDMGANDLTPLTGLVYPSPAQVDEHELSLGHELDTAEDDTGKVNAAGVVIDEEEDENPFGAPAENPGFPPGYNPELFGVSNEDEVENPFEA
jgi:hypothetical protein